MLLRDTQGGLSAGAPAGGGTVRSRWRDGVPGAILIAIAALALYSGRDLPLGSAIHIGPGAIPDILAALLMLLGVIVAVESALQRRNGGRP